VPSSAGYRQPNQLFLNDGRGRFTESRRFRSVVAGRLAKSRGAAHGDLDGDGDLDIVVSNIDARPTLLENRTAAAARWVRVVLVGRASNRAAIGARVTRTSYLSQCDLYPSFALGAGDVGATLEVEWPSGLRERFAVAAAAGGPLAEGAGER
jgi:hypothetical protein